MADPTTTNIKFYQPTRGSDVGTWDLPVNANAGAADSLAANVASVALANATLTVAPADGSLWAGPYQSQSALLRFSGALGGDITITLPRSGFWLVQNLCSSGNGSFAVKLASAAPGNVICAPPFEIVKVFCDGTDVNYVDFDRVGSYLDLGASTVPVWITKCTVPPYLNCDGTTFSAVTYPWLNSLLGGNTLPDLRGRIRAALNQTTGRITSAVSGVDGNTILSTGGSQSHTLTIGEMPAHAHTDSGHQHTVPIFANVSGPGGGGNYAAGNVGTPTSTSISAANIQNTGGGTAHSILNPIAISGLTLIRAG